MRPDGAITLLDGAMGTLLGQRGVDTRGPLFSAAALLDAEGRALLVQAHRDYLEAGAEVLTAVSFRTARRSLVRAGLGDRFPDLAQAAVAAARAACAAAGTAGLRVAGSLAPLEDCYRPDLSPPAAEARAEHAEHARALAAAGCDLLLVESVSSQREGLVALEAALATGLPVWLSAMVTPACTLLDASPLGALFQAAARAGALALLVNCTPPDGVDAALDALSATGLPFGAYAHLGEVDPACGWPSLPPLTPAEYARRARRWAAAGARVVGGCCGTSPAHVAALRQAFTSAPLGVSEGGDP